MKTDRTELEKQQKVMKRRQVALGVAATALVGGIGCATIATSSNLKKSVPVESPEVLEDSIVALGRPSEALGKAMNNKNAVAFMGLKKTYLLIEGGEKILRFSTELDASRLNLIKNSHKLYLENDKTWGQLHFTYKAEPEEEKKLRQLGFVLASAQTGLYETKVYVSGAVYPPFTVHYKSFNPLTQSRELTFRAPPTYEKRPNWNAIAFLPVALVVDVITSPVQILFFGTFLISEKK